MFKGPLLLLILHRAASADPCAGRIHSLHDLAQNRCITPIQEALTLCSSLIPVLNRTRIDIVMKPTNGKAQCPLLLETFSPRERRALEAAAGRCRDGSRTRCRLFAHCAVQRCTGAGFLTPESQLEVWILAIETGPGVHRAWSCMNCCSQDGCRGVGGHCENSDRRRQVGRYLRCMDVMGAPS